MEAAKNLKALSYIITVSLILLTGCADKSGQSYTDAGIRKLRSGDYEVAIDFLEEALSRNPSNAVALCNLGIAHWKTGNYQASLKPLASASQINTEDPVSQEYLGLVYIELKEWDMARKTFFSALRRKPDSARIVSYLALVELRVDNYLKSRNLFERALEIDPEYSPALYNLGLLYSGQASDVIETGRGENEEKAAEFFSRYLQVGSNQDRIKNAKRYINTNQTLPVEAKPGVSMPMEPDDQPVLQKTDLDSETSETLEPGQPVKISNDKKKPSTRPQAGDHRKELGARPAKTEKINPVIIDIREALINHEYDKALVMLNESIHKDPRDPDLLWELAKVYDNHLEYKERATEIYERFASIFPDDPRAKQMHQMAADSPDSNRLSSKKDTIKAMDEYGKGVQFHKIGDIEEAIKHYKKALTFDDSIFQAVFNMGIIYLDKDNHDAAEKSFLHAVRIEPERANALYMLGVVYWEKKDHSNALKYLNKALRIKPDYAQVHFVLGLVYNDQKRKDLAKRHFEHCSQLASGKSLGHRADEWLKYMAQ